MIGNISNFNRWTVNNNLYKVHCIYYPLWPGRWLYISIYVCIVCTVRCIGMVQINSALNCSNTPINKTGRYKHILCGFSIYIYISIFSNMDAHAVPIEASSCFTPGYTLTCPFDTSLKINIAEWSVFITVTH